MKGGPGAQIGNHLKNIAINHGLAALATTQIGEFWKAFVMLKPSKLKNNQWNGYSSLVHSNFKCYINPKIVDSTQQKS